MEKAKSFEKTEVIPFKEFYYELAEKLLEYKNKRNKLINFLHKLKDDGLQITPLNDQNPEGTTIELEDIDPFTFFGIFNRGITNDNRIKILKILKEFFNLNAEIPNNFDGIPVLNNQKSWFFTYKYKRKDEDIDLLWELFEKFMNDTIDDELFNKCLEIKGVRQNITIAFYWIKPEDYIALDNNTTSYIAENTKFKNTNINKLKFRGYKEIIKTLKEKNISFYELVKSQYGNSNENNDMAIQNKKNSPIEQPLNQILYGPPGTGKTYHTINKALEIIFEKEDENKTIQYKYLGHELNKSVKDLKKILNQNTHTNSPFRY
ncbi:hypothetical protein [Hydrogenimonas thermophila]|uniref:5-methylcytosine-specific restriction enzyme B n=1 Tax=Hydrogenimonas thermophila TaxID=223786 RepID=A0A1I5UXL3_9BACT|nr:hypothetical protein [Hydrogenimonas thermophila]SFP99446.1 hypothetical protein SAMN05216234_1733 [Hydrogenimonas thermophila]